jgi:hypothetical protein
MRQVSVLLCGFVLATLVPASASADTVYTYTGSPFDEVSQPFTTSDHVAISITQTSPLAANLSVLTPDSDWTSVSVSVGIFSFDYTNSTLGPFTAIAFGTDSSGTITSWNIEADIPSLAVSSTPLMDSAELTTGAAIYSGEVLGDPGLWTAPTSTAPTPEPSSIALFASGALGLIAMFRRRLAA